MKVVSITFPKGWSWAAAIFCAVLIAGCDEEPPTEPQGPTLQEVQDEVFTTSCAVPGCHAGVDPPEGLDLTEDSAHENLVNVPSGQVPELMRVEPGNAEDSYLYVKIVGSDRMAPGTFQMPIGVELTDAQIHLVQEWIDAGAEP